MACQISCNDCPVRHKCGDKPRPYLNAKETEEMFILAAFIARIEDETKTEQNPKIHRDLSVALRLVQRALDRKVCGIPLERLTEYIKRKGKKKIVMED